MTAGLLQPRRSSSSGVHVAVAAAARRAGAAWGYCRGTPLRHGHRGLRPLQPRPMRAGMGLQPRRTRAAMMLQPCPMRAAMAQLQAHHTRTATVGSRGAAGGVLQAGVAASEGGSGAAGAALLVLVGSWVVGTVMAAVRVVLSWTPGGRARIWAWPGGEEHPPQALLRTPRALRNTPQALRNTPRALRNTPLALRNTPRALRNTPQVLRNTPRALRYTPRALRNTHFQVDPAAKPPWPRQQQQQQQRPMKARRRPVFVTTVMWHGGRLPDHPTVCVGLWL